ncbi:MAG TPA: hypothetical protein ENJ42_09465 [Hellea balneolensis]|uniref:VOC domain-containing protein n=1 Tax=Hellea balneolensis TaxID=287478 RepID=A0A7C5M4E2_9PROT|nr:hypothetical protein [Hellea balneolensis]
MSKAATGIIRRTSFVVADADQIANFYQSVFGWTRFYDNETAVDRRFPPSAPDETMARIIILKADDPYIGMVGFMEYVDFVPEPATNPAKTKLGLGDPILVVEANDIESAYANALSAGARMVSEPIKWSVKDYDGVGDIHLCTFSFFDPNGIYVEVNTRL